MYQYYASSVGGGVWMVRRWKDDPNDYTEAEMFGMSADAQANDVIEAAIQRNSWA